MTNQSFYLTRIGTGIQRKSATILRMIHGFILFAKIEQRLLFVSFHWRLFPGLPGSWTCDGQQLSSPLVDVGEVAGVAIVPAFSRYFYKDERPPTPGRAGCIRVPG